MGSGKTTVGKALADRISWQFCDLDDLIIQRTGLAIADLFERYGEAEFRKVEHSAVFESSFFQKTVVATGGGAPCYHDNLATMKEKGIVIFLKTSVTTIIDRIRKDTSVRPLLQLKTESELHEYVEEHLRSRNEYYNRAEIMIDGDQPVAQIVSEIVRTLKGSTKINL